MGLNIENIKKVAEKVSKAEKETKKESNKKTHGEKMDYLQKGIDVIESTSSLIETIITARKETHLAKINLDSKQIELERDLGKYQTTLQKEIKEMEKEVEKYRIDSEIKLKELDVSIHELKESEETKRLQIQKDHETKMRMLDMQQSILETVMEMYKQYYAAMFAGVVLPVTPANMTNDMQNCIQSLNTSIQYLNQPQSQITMNKQLDY
ncbi:hypothetical protein SAMN05443252_101848 [Bacillus sp. OV322]|uniref:hypothetical protein n=1 Tax=Bacillus sp. OV322 TaxID=1882764 RepID=UPI0008F0981A|nr:hypothetical protein [Bacillus sp. OV322]SFC09377.1 hypothetical protein SAMN05443252_101848 [Bacillus sp. OV322]